MARPNGILAEACISTAWRRVSFVLVYTLSVSVCFAIMANRRACLYILFA